MKIFYQKIHNKLILNFHNILKLNTQYANSTFNMQNTILQLLML